MPTLYYPSPLTNTGRCGINCLVNKEKQTQVTKLDLHTYGLKCKGASSPLNYACLAQIPPEQLKIPQSDTPS